MWIHIPPNETAWEMPKTGKKRCVHKGTFGDVRVQISNKKLQLRKAKAPRKLWLEKCTVLDKQSSFWQDTIQHERSSNLAETFSNEVTSAWQNRQETDFKKFSCRRSRAIVVWSANFCHDSCESGSAGSSLPSVCARVALTVPFSHRFCSWSRLDHYSR